jgi:HlyD family secretion protein
MAASDEIFRKVALERLSSPEHLDRLITLTSPMGWIALATIGVLLTAIVAWGFVGSIPTRVQGVGILVSRGGHVFDAMAPAAGTLITVAGIGRKVAKGDIVATFDDTQAREDLLHAENVLQEQESDLSQLIARYDAEIAAHKRVDAQQRQNFEEIIGDAKQRRTFYENALNKETPVAANGFLTQRFMQETRQRMEAAVQDEQKARSSMLQLDAEKLALKDRRDQDIYHQHEAVNAARRTVEALKIRNQRTLRSISPVDGHVTEIKAGIGTVVAAGRPIVSIETGGKGLELVLYIPPSEGKKVAPGMPVRIELSTFKKEEFGTLKGRVLSISDFPVSAEGMNAILQNSELVKRFSARGAPYLAHVSLITDSSTASGYAWSAGRGPTATLSSGTTADAEVTVRRQTLVTLVLPLLRGWFGSVQ